MRFYSLLNFQHVMLYIFPTLVFVTALALSLKGAHFKTRRSEHRNKDILHQYPDDLQEKNASFPIVMALIIIGTVLWAIAYILLTGLGEV